MGERGENFLYRKIHLSLFLFLSQEINIDIKTICQRLRIYFFVSENYRP